MELYRPVGERLETYPREEPEKPDSIVLRLFWIGYIVVITCCAVLAWIALGREKVNPNILPAPEPSIAQKYGCEPWREGLSKNFAIFVAEIDGGESVVSCVRFQERHGKRKMM